MASLFGNLGSGGQQKPSLFGTPASTAPASQPGGGLFGSSTATTSAGGLFSNLGAPTTSASSGSSLFSSAQPASTGSGLFGGLGGTTTAPSSGSSLFATSQPAATGATGLSGALGGATAQPTATGSSLFGQLGTAPSGHAASSTQASATSGLFGSTLLGSQQNQTGAQVQTAPGTSEFDASKPLSSAHFDHLLERGKKRNSDHNGVPQSHFGELPSLQLGLGDIARKVQGLGGGSPSGGLARSRKGDTKAHYLLAASGINTASTLRDLNTFSAQAGANLQPSAHERDVVTDTDLDGYVASLRNRSTLDLIQEGLEQSKRDFDTFLEENVQLNWDLQRRRIYEHFGLARRNETVEESINGAVHENERGAFGLSSRKSRGFGKSSLGGAGMSRSVLGTPSAGNGRASVFGADAEKNVPNIGQGGAEDRFQRDRQEKFADKVKALNISRIQGQAYPLLHSFRAAESEIGLDSAQPLVQSYAAVIEITGEPPEPRRFSDPTALKERSFRNDYRDERESPNSNKALEMRRKIINGSRRLLEQQFYSVLTSAVDKNPREANVGGVPGKLDRIRGYVRILAVRKELGSDVSQLQQVGEDYCFAVVYFLLRSGLFKEAQEYTESIKRALQHIDRNFVRYVACYAQDSDRRLPQDLQQRITTEYHGQMKIAPESSIDPYRMACYKVLGRCELGRRSLEGISIGWEDYIWLQFSLAREQNRAETSAGETFGLEQLREEVKQIGERHFSAGQSSSDIGGYGMFFFLQILAGMFENAVDWLYKNDVVAAVHFAIALDYYGLLRIASVTAPQDSLLTYSTRQLPQIQFGFMIGYYTSPFRTAYPLVAADYLTLIALNADLEGEAGKQQADLCWEALRELVLETREFAALLGDVKPDGSIVQGSIQQRSEILKLHSHQNFIRNITIAAATLADEAGRVTDAVLLYHLAEQFDAVVTTVSRALSEAIAVDLGQEPIRLEPLKPAPDPQKPSSGNQTSQPPSETLSLTSVDNPLELAKIVFNMYNSDAARYRSIRQLTLQSCHTLIRIATAKSHIEHGAWDEALQIVQSLMLLPLKLTRDNVASNALTTTASPPPNSNLTVIRERAALLPSLPEAVVHTIPALLLMTLTALSRYRGELQRNPFTDGDATRRGLVKALGDAARDLMIYAGLVKYKLPGRVFEKLGEVVAEEGGL